MCVCVCDRHHLHMGFLLIQCLFDSRSAPLSKFILTVRSLHVSHRIRYFFIWSFFEAHVTARTVNGATRVFFRPVTSKVLFTGQKASLDILPHAYKYMYTCMTKFSSQNKSRFQVHIYFVPLFSYIVSYMNKNNDLYYQHIQGNYKRTKTFFFIISLFS